MTKQDVKNHIEAFLVSLVMMFFCACGDVLILGTMAAMIYGIAHLFGVL